MLAASAACAKASSGSSDNPHSSSAAIRWPSIAAFARASSMSMAMFSTPASRSAWRCVLSMTTYVGGAMVLLRGHGSG